MFDNDVRPGRAIIQYDDAWLLFDEPLEIVSAATADEVLPALEAVCEAVDGRWLTAVGFVAYEAAGAYGLAVHEPIEGLPLAWFGLYRDARRTSRPTPPGTRRHAIGEFAPSLSRRAYGDAVAAIHRYIAGGDCYQINYTFALRARFRGDPLGLFADMIEAQRGAAYTAYLDTGRFAIASASPELFFELDGERLVSRPMKGTASRGRTRTESDDNGERLRGCAKNRAENLMIVDMIRNDMARAAEPGSVAVPRLFDIETYPSLLQMTSTVEARSRAGVDVILANMFPCASITGAPKVRTMELIRELEAQPRGVYTGALGVIAPGRRARFSVAIRTALVDRAGNSVHYAVGSGIVWDSRAGSEYDECLLKARVVTAGQPAFELLETMLWRPGRGIWLEREHWRRLEDSAAYFGFDLDRAALEAALAVRLARLAVASRVRLRLSRDGTFRIETAPAPRVNGKAPAVVGLAREPVDSKSPWLFHKTTNRRIHERARASRSDTDDVILWNERNELTESTSANLVLAIGGGLWTPPRECGLLAGTLRARLLNAGVLRERVLGRRDLQGAEGVYLINSVRGWQAVRRAGE